MSEQIVIIGAGLAGLTFGAMAARDGRQVTVIDKNTVPGGVCAAAVLDTPAGTFRFEQGPLILSDLLPGESVYEFLDGFGIHLETKRADRGTATPDFALWKPEEYQGKYWRREKLKELFPEDAAGIDEYYRFYDTLMHIRYLSTLPQNALTKLRMGLAFLRIKKYEPLSADEFTRKLFKSEKLRLVFIGILADFCADPAEVSCFTIPFTNIETAFDKRIPLERGGKHYYPGFANIVGGVQKLPEALADYIVAHGGKILYNTVADKVLIEDGAVTGVRLTDGTVLPADVVTAAGSARDFFTKAVGLEHLTDEYREIVAKYRPMEAVFMLHLAVDFNPLEFQPAPLCYYYGSYDLHAATERLRTGVYHGGDDGYLIYVPDDHAPDFAPAGYHALTIYTVAPDRLGTGSWADAKELFADRLINLAERQLPGLSGHIIARKIMTAEDFREFTHMEKSSFGGNVPVRDLPQPPHKTPIRGLYFLGQQSENGGGVTAVIMGAKDAYEKAGVC